MALSIISSTDLASYPGAVLGDQSTTDLVVELANGLVKEIIGDLNPVPTRVRALTLEVAARALRNPEGYSSVTRQLDDWKTTVRREGDDTTGATGVYLSPAEENYLYALVGRGSRSARSIRLSVPGYGYGDSF